MSFKRNILFGILLSAGAISVPAYSTELSDNIEVYPPTPLVAQKVSLVQTNKSINIPYSISVNKTNTLLAKRISLVETNKSEIQEENVKIPEIRGAISKRISLVNTNKPTKTLDNTAITLTKNLVSQRISLVETNSPAEILDNTNIQATDDFVAQKISLVKTNKSIKTEDSKSIPATETLVSQSISLVETNKPTGILDNAEIPATETLIAQKISLVETNKATVTKNNASIPITDTLISQRISLVETNKPIETSNNVDIPVTETLIAQKISILERRKPSSIPDNNFIGTTETLVSQRISLVETNKPMEISDNTEIPAAEMLVAQKISLVETNKATDTEDNTSIPSTDTLVSQRISLVETNKPTEISDNTEIPAAETLIAQKISLVETNKAIETEDNASIPDTDTLISQRISLVETNKPTEISGNTEIPAAEMLVAQRISLVETNKATEVEDNTSIPDTDTLISQRISLVETNKPEETKDNASIPATNTLISGVFETQDTIPPEISLIYDGDTWTKEGVEIKVSVFDNVEIASVLPPNGKEILDTSFTFIATENGDYVFRAKDTSGNTSEVTANIRNIDRDAPTMESEILPSEWTNSSVSIKVTALDDKSGVQRIVLPDGNWIFDDVVEFSVSDNGEYIFSAEDNLGNISNINVVVSNIDKIAPNEVSLLKSESKEWHNSDVTITMTNNGDNLSGVDYMEYTTEKGKKGWMKYTEPVIISDEGKHTVRGRAFDKAGNETEKESSIDVWIDKTAPTIEPIEINRGEEYANENMVSFRVRGFDKDSGLESVLVSSDGVEWTKKPYSINQEYLLKDEGLSTVYVKLRDAAGNESAIEKDMIFLDTIKPTGTVSINGGEGTTDSTDVKLDIEYVENGSGIDWIKVIEDGAPEVFIPSELFASSPMKLNWTLEPGFHKDVSVVIADKAGNISEPFSDSILVDKLHIEDFTIENVPNPEKYNPFIPDVWQFEPKEMLSGTWIDFSAKLNTSIYGETVSESMGYTIEIENIDSYKKTLMGNMNLSGDKYFGRTKLPSDAPATSKVYITLDAERRLNSETQTSYFPGNDSSTKALIGIIAGDINELVKFNEIN